MIFAYRAFAPSLGTLQALGLVNRVVPDAQLLPAALTLADQVAQRSAGATARLKRVLLQGQPLLAQALEQERQAAMACFAAPDTAARVKAFAGGRR